MQLRLFHMSIKHTTLLCCLHLHCNEVLLLQYKNFDTQHWDCSIHKKRVNIQHCDSSHTQQTLISNSCFRKRSQLSVAKNKTYFFRAAVIDWTMWMKYRIDHIITHCLVRYNQSCISSFKLTGELKIPDEFCSQDLNLDSDLQYLLPRRQGPGLCATGLVSYLVALHNELVNAVDSLAGDDSRYKT